MKLSTRFVCALVCTCFTALPIFSQTAQLTGTVVDQSGSVVTNVKLSAANVDTGVVRGTVSNDAGNYLITGLLPGLYRVTAEVAGFKQQVRGPLTLAVDQNARLDFALEVGETRESVSVEATAVQLESATSAVGSVVESRQLAELPMNGRNPVDLLGLTAGIRVQSGFGGVLNAGGGTTQSGAWSGFSFNGGIAGANPMLVEGLALDSAVMNLPSYVPTVDATQEFRAQTSTFSAEYGRTTGAVINFSIKSGTNSFHGTAYDYWKNKNLNANDFFRNAGGRGRTAFNQHQFGASLGGPIKRDKAFFFGNYEEYSIRSTGDSSPTSVPTSLQRAGDFSQTRTATGGLVVIADPLNYTPAAVGVNRVPFPGNVIPPGRISTVARNVAKVYPDPNAAGVAFTNTNNYIGVSRSRNNQHNMVGKFDYNFNSMWRVFGTYARLWDQPVSSNPWPNPIDFTRHQTNDRHHTTLTTTAVFSPTVIGSFHTGFARITAVGEPGAAGFDIRTLGFPNILAQTAQITGFPRFSITGLAGIGSASSAGANIGYFNTWGERASITWVKGVHTIKFGTDFRVQQMNHQFQNSFLPAFNFTNQFTALNPLSLNANSGVPMASFMLGYVSTASAAKSPAFANQRKYWAFFIQDDWKVNSKLSINFGTDFSLEFPITDRFNRKMWFDETATLPISSRVGFPVRGGFIFANNDTRAPYDLYLKQIGPRLGLAYQASKKTVVRSAFGLFWIPANLSEVVGGSRAPGWELSTQMLSTTDGGITPKDTLDNPYPQGIQDPPGSSQGLNSLIGQPAAANHRFYHTGYMGQWNFNIQHQLMNNAVLEVYYAGSMGVGLPAGFAAQSNQLPDQYLSMGSALQQLVPNPYYGLVQFGPLSQPTVQRAQLLRPYSQFDTLFDEGNPVGHSNYHSFQMQYKHRFGSSLVTTSYTLSKSMGNTEARLDTGGNSSGFLNTYNRGLSRAVSAYDVPQRLVVSYSYSLPFGKGKRWLATDSVFNKVIGGWEVNGIYTAQSGTPLAFSTSTNLTGNLNAVTDVYGTFVSNAVPNNNGTSAKLEGDPRNRLTKWFDTATFSQPAAFTYGTAGRISPNVRTHGTNNLDFSLFKNTRFGHDERYNVQLRAEAFNVANRVKFGSPGTTFGNNTFGVISSQGNNPRQVQLALKVIF